MGRMARLASRPIIFHQYLLIYCIIDHTCLPYEIDCGSGLCLGMNFRCNGIPECPNGKDENYCGIEIFFIIFHSWVLLPEVAVMS